MMAKAALGGPLKAQATVAAYSMLRRRSDKLDESSRLQEGCCEGVIHLPVRGGLGDLGFMHSLHELSISLFGVNIVRCCTCGLTRSDYAPSKRISHKKTQFMNP